MKRSTVYDQFKSFPSRSIKKGEYLLRPGDLTKNFFYVEKGCLRSYVTDSKGKEHVYQFAPEDWVISDEEALMENKPAILYIDAIEDSEIKVLSNPDLNEWTNLDKDAASQMIQQLQKKINTFRRRIIQLLSASAEQRYSTFIKTYPNLAQRIPQKMIASYLGITPESLSRVRKELSEKK